MVGRRRRAASHFAVARAVARGYIAGMAIFATILMVIGMLATLGVLATGIISMARGGEFNERWGNRLMRYRIVAQGFALAMFAVGLILLKSAG